MQIIIYKQKKQHFSVLLPYISCSQKISLSIFSFSVSLLAKLLAFSDISHQRSPSFHCGWDFAYCKSLFPFTHIPIAASAANRIIVIIFISSKINFAYYQSLNHLYK